MTNKPPIDFAKVEALRKHMLLTVNNMAELFGVSRMTYYSWLNGVQPRKANAGTVRNTLMKLLAVMTDYEWPQPEVIAMEQEQRYSKLLEILAELN